MRLRNTRKEVQHWIANVSVVGREWTDENSARLSGITSFFLQSTYENQQRETLGTDAGCPKATTVLKPNSE